MKKTTTQIKKQQSIPTHHSTLLPVLLAMILAGTLVNSRLFISSSLASYFLYTTFASVFIAVSGVLFLTSHQPIRATSSGQLFSAPMGSLPVLLFLLWALYIWINGILISPVFTLWHYYFIISCLFFISFSIAERTIPSAGRKLFIIISILACIESLICVFQYVGWVPGNNRFFTVTGTWVNPNITAMFLAMAAPAVLFLLFTTKGLFRRMTVAILILITVALFLLKCRTAFAGALTTSGIILNNRFHWLQWFKNRRNVFLKILLLLVITAIVSLACFYAYQFKKASADGRKLVWKISLQMIATKPFTGYGYGMFERDYNLIQADYFRSGQGSAQEKNEAAYVHMVYNEFLQNAVEGGVPGVLLFTGILASLLVLPLVNIKKDGKPSKTGATAPIPKSSTTIINSITGNSAGSNNNITNNENETAHTAYAGLVAFTLMSVLNFTVQATPVWCLFILYAGLSSVLYAEEYTGYPPKFLVRPSPYASLPVTSKQGKLFLGSLLIITGVCFFFFEGNSGSAHLQMEKVTQLTDAGKYRRATQKLKSTEGILSHSEIYWQSLGRIAIGQKDYTTALTMFNKVKEYTSNPDLYIQTGNCYENLGQYQDAEKDYLTAAYMEPSRMAPHYALMTMYQKTGDRLRTLTEAKEIMTLQPKVASSQAQEYKNQAAAVLHQLQTNRLLLITK